MFYSEIKCRPYNIFFCFSSLVCFIWSASLTIHRISSDDCDLQQWWIILDIEYGVLDILQNVQLKWKFPSEVW